MIRSVVMALCLSGLFLNAMSASDPMKPPQFAPAAVEQSAVKRTSFTLQQIKMSQIRFEFQLIRVLIIQIVLFS